MTTDNRPVVFCTATSSIIDFCGEGEAPETAIQRLAEYGTSLTVLPLDEAWQRHENAHKSEPIEITAAQFDEMLNVLPPINWMRDSHGESFKMVERLTGAITGIYVQLNGRYFTFNDDIRMPHAECCRRVFQSMAYRAPVQTVAASPDVPPPPTPPSDRDDGRA